MRIKGTGNIIVVEGTVDSPDNKRFWGQHGPRAVSLARKALAANPSLRSESKAMAIELDSFVSHLADCSQHSGLIVHSVAGMPHLVHA